MPRKPKAAQVDDEPCQRICGNCRYYDLDLEAPESGECFLNPPTPLVSDEDVFCARPLVDAADRACSHFAVRLQS